jgi:hypothetical protein
VIITELLHYRVGDRQPCVPLVEAVEGTDVSLDGFTAVVYPDARRGILPERTRARCPLLSIPAPSVKPSPGRRPFGGELFINEPTG